MTNDAERVRALTERIAALADEWEREGGAEPFAWKRLRSIAADAIEGRGALVVVELECGHTRQLAPGIVRAIRAGHFDTTWCDHLDCECHRRVTSPADTEGEEPFTTARDRLDLHLLATQGRTLGEKPWTDS